MPSRGKRHPRQVGDIMREAGQSVTRHAARRDENEPEIIEALEAVGCDVVKLSARHVADLLVGRAGVNYLLEVKTATGKLTEGQERFAEWWRGRPVAVVRTQEEAVRAVGL